jgi:hypothetical protein
MIAAAGGGAGIVDAESGLLPVADGMGGVITNRNREAASIVSWLSYVTRIDVSVTQ